MQLTTTTLAHQDADGHQILETVEICPLCQSGRARTLFHVFLFGFHRCSDCGLVRLSPRIARSSLGLLYSGNLGPIESSEVTEMELRNPTFGHRKTILERYSRQRVLMEIGCGDGNFLAYLRRRGWHVFGTEFTEENVALVRQKHSISVSCGDYREMRWADQSFPAIGMYHVLEHMYDPVSTIADVARTLEPTGILHIQMPYLDGLDGRLSGKYFWALRTPQHVLFYNPRTIRQLLALSGLQVLRIQTYDPWHSPTTTANTIRAMLAGMLRAKPPTLTLDGSLLGGTEPAAKTEARGWLRVIAEQVLRVSAALVARGEAMIGVGNVIDVVAQKP